MVIYKLIKAPLESQVKGFTWLSSETLFIHRALHQVRLVV